MSMPSQMTGTTCGLADAEYAPGVYHVQWGGTDSANTSVSSGVYLVRMTTDEWAITKRMFLR